MEKNWRFKDENHLKEMIVVGEEFYTAISNNDKDFMKSNITNCMLLVNKPSIKKQYIRCLNLMIRHDYPEKWPHLLEQTLQNINSSNEKSLMVGL